MDKSLEEKLTFTFAEPMDIPGVEQLLLHITKQLHARVTYRIINYKHAGTIRDEVPVEMFKLKHDRTNIEGSVMVLYQAAFTLPSYADELYHKIDFQPAAEEEFPAPGWPENYYAFIEEIKKAARSYFSPSSD